MPELPDVEGYRRDLAATLPGRQICRVDVRDAGVLRNTTPRTLCRQLMNHRFADPQRHGKWLILPTDGPTLLVHSGMTGRPYYADNGQPEQGFEHLVIGLDRGQLRYADLRKLRGVWLAGDDDEVAGVMGKQGPDALGLDLRSCAPRATRPPRRPEADIDGSIRHRRPRQPACRRDPLAGRAQSVAASRRPRRERNACAAHLDETRAAHGGAARLRAVVAALADAGTGRPRPELPAVRHPPEP